MCFSLLLPALLGIGQGVLQYTQNKKAEKNAQKRADARNAELRAHQARQKRFAEENQRNVDRTVEQFNPNEQLEIRNKAEEDIGQRYARSVEGPRPSTLFTGSEPKVVKDAAAKRLSDALTKGKTRAQSAAKLGSFGEQLFANKLNTAQLGRQVGTTNSFARAEAGLLPHLQDLAEAKVANGGGSGFGSLLSGALGGASTYLGSQANQPSGVFQW